MMVKSNIEIAGDKVASRYYRRFPNAPDTRWNATLIRELKWYRNVKRLVAARTRFGEDTELC